MTTRIDKPKPAAGRKGMPLVQATANRLRDQIFAAEPESFLGSLNDIAQSLGVGIVTVQQAARILEHEGLLDVRRGPGGGYFGKRPDGSVLERSLAAYLRIEPASWEEALVMTSLLFIELAGAAAACEEESLREQLERFFSSIDACDEGSMGSNEQRFQEILFRMVNRPLFELLTRVTLFVSNSRSSALDHIINLDEWKLGRKRIVAAIMAADAELARFEADRHNRKHILRAIAAQHTKITP